MPLANNVAVPHLDHLPPPRRYPFGLASDLTTNFCRFVKNIQASRRSHDPSEPFHKAKLLRRGFQQSLPWFRMDLITVVVCLVNGSSGTGPLVSRRADHCVCMVESFANSFLSQVSGRRRRRKKKKDNNKCKVIVNTIPPNTAKHTCKMATMKTMATVKAMRTRCATNYSIITNNNRNDAYNMQLTSTTPMTTLTHCTRTSTDAWRTCTETARASLFHSLMMTPHTSWLKF